MDNIDNDNIDNDNIDSDEEWLEVFSFDPEDEQRFKENKKRSYEQNSLINNSSSTLSGTSLSDSSWRTNTPSPFVGVELDVESNSVQSVTPPPLVFSKLRISGSAESCTINRNKNDKSPLSGYKSRKTLGELITEAGPDSNSSSKKATPENKESLPPHLMVDRELAKFPGKPVSSKQKNII
jgi:hypothetical protein